MKARHRLTAEQAEGCEQTRAEEAAQDAVVRRIGVMAQSGAKVSPEKRARFLGGDLTAACPCGCGNSVLPGSRGKPKMFATEACRRRFDRETRQVGARTLLRRRRGRSMEPDPLKVAAVVAWAEARKPADPAEWGIHGNAAHAAPREGDGVSATTPESKPSANSPPGRISGIPPAPNSMEKPRPRRPRRPFSRLLRRILRDHKDTRATRRQSKNSGTGRP